MENSKIQWCEHTFNPWIGCTKVHEGCTHCYAEADMDKRRGRVKWGPSGTRSKTSAEYWKQPLKWNREAVYSEIDHEAESNLGKDMGTHERPRVFCASLADVFEDWQGDIVDSNGCPLLINDGEGANGAIYPEGVPVEDDWGCRGLTMDDLRRDLFALIDATPNLDWLLVTKRPENIRRMWPDMYDIRAPFPGAPGGLGKPLPCVVKNPRRKNVWLLTSVSNQETYDKMAPHLWRCRDLVPVLGFSGEPLLGPIKIYHDFDGEKVRNWKDCWNWWIVGGESGHGARPCNVEWIRSIVRQCKTVSVPCFVKQLGSSAVVSDAETGGQSVRIELKDKKGGDISEWPKDLQVRQFPELEAV